MLMLVLHHAGSRSSCEAWCGVVLCALEQGFDEARRREQAEAQSSRA